MPKAEVYYYPIGLGHTSVNIIFSKSEIPEKKEYQLLIYSKSNPPRYKEKECKLYARSHYCPVLFLQDNGEFSIYGYKEGSWQETPLNNLSLEEQTLLQNLAFQAVIVKKNDRYTSGSYENGIWQKKVLPEGYIHLSSDFQRKQIKPSDPLYQLMQKGHPEFKRTEYFFDWGGAYDFEENMEDKGRPIRFALPPTTKSFIDFFTAVEKSDYTFEPPYNSTYRLFTNNCAHATMEILHCAGYTSEKPTHRFALTPISVAKKVYALAHQSRALFRKQLLESISKTDTKQLINTLIELSINRLNDSIYFNYGKYIGSCSKELENISKIKYDGSYESIERLLKASEEANPYTAQELEECIALVDPEICLNAGIARLETVANKLKNRENADNLQAVATKLRWEYKNFKEGAVTYEQFAQKSSALIDEASPILQMEKNVFLQILKNIALAVCAVIALYLVAGFINKSNTGSFLFFNEPSLSKIGANIKNNVSDLNPGIIQI
ncbi:hypothetical protein [Legionella cardiaca]|uniref:DUF4105 domain-containing protein n=1 Tax=Legionella cardiaca TaxID=1071983 RepID=A0ABY8AMX4_9GAMM|nr:hypothetical protein [Legionella cardiaca]WED41878.1 hypothetical protein PXX05_08010 [Legionella cardiaca]